MLLMGVRVKTNMPIIFTWTNYNLITINEIKTILVINGKKLNYVSSSLVIPYWVSVNQTKLIEVMIILQCKNDTNTP